jgi:hypothetical protein
MAAEDVSWIKYIDDHKMFVPEDKATGRSSRVVYLARVIIETKINEKIAAKFEVAEAEWGYQVNFTGLKIEKDGQMVNVNEGFGNIYFDKMISRIKVDYGP